MKIISGKLYDDNRKLLDESPKFVFPCCRRKNETAMFQYNGINREFYAMPRNNPPIGTSYEVPFGKVPGTDKTWSDIVKENWDKKGTLGMPAYELYQGGGNIYQYSYNKLKERLFFLSPAWGILPADMRLPLYYATFQKTNKKNPPYMIRDENWQGKDWTLSDFGIKNDGKNDGKDDRHYIILVAGENYHKMFLNCTENFKKRCIVAINNPNIDDPNIGEVNFIDGKKYLNNPNQRTNWYYTALRNMLI